METAVSSRHGVKEGDLIRVPPDTLIGGDAYDEPDVPFDKDWNSAPGETGVVLKLISRGSDRSIALNCLFQRGPGWILDDEIAEVLSSAAVESVR